MMMNEIDRYLFRKEIEMEADELKKERSSDYIEGFDDACRLLLRYYKVALGAGNRRIINEK